MLMKRRIGNWWPHPKTVDSIWIISSSSSSSFSFFCVFQMALYNSSDSTSFTSSDSENTYWEQRSKLYEKMARDMDEHGAAFLKHGETSQSLSLSDIFTLKDGSVTPILKPANPPVRAIVLHLSTEFSVPIAEAAKSIFNPYFNKAIWFQNSSMYHFSMFHASNNLAPIPATEEEIEAEVSSVQAVAGTLCPLNIVLDRVVLTSSGVLLGCWQVISGTDPVTIRAKLRDALPHASEKQLYDPPILYTSFARLLGPPNALPTQQKTSSELQIFHELVNLLNNQIYGFKAVVSDVWYVEEYDVLALALNGRMNIRKFKVGGCSAA